MAAPLTAIKTQLRKAEASNSYNTSNSITQMGNNTTS